MEEVAQEAVGASPYLPETVWIEKDEHWYDVGMPGLCRAEQLKVGVCACCYTAQCSYTQAKYGLDNSRIKWQGVLAIDPHTFGIWMAWSRKVMDLL